MSIGKLRIHVLEGHLTHDTETFGKMDPYVKMTCRDDEWKSTVASDMGKKPKWTGQFFDINVHYLGDDVHFKVWDDDVGKDDFVGEGSTKLSALVHENGIYEWFDIQFKGKPAGKLHFKCHWEPADPNKVGH